jgi:hypothetical protein
MLIDFLSPSSSVVSAETTSTWQQFPIQNFSNYYQPEGEFVSDMLFGTVVIRILVQHLLSYIVQWSSKNTQTL